MPNMKLRKTHNELHSNHEVNGESHMYFKSNRKLIKSQNDLNMSQTWKRS